MLRRAGLLVLSVVVTATGSGCYLAGKAAHADEHRCLPDKASRVIFDAAGMATSIAESTYVGGDTMEVLGILGFLAFGASVVVAAADRCGPDDVEEIPDEPPPPLAWDVYERACDDGVPRACLALARDRRETDPALAARYTARACKLGEVSACPAPTPPTLAGHGSCFFVSESGIAVTSHHVVADAVSIQVLDSRGVTYPATVMRDLEDVDLAVLDVPGAVPAHGLAVSPAAALTLGQPVFTIGFSSPATVGFDPAFAEGPVTGLSGLGQPWLFQLSVPVQPGNSGGPVVDEHGFAVGVIVAKLRLDKVLEATGTVPENVNFAVKDTELRRALHGIALPAPTPAPDRAAAIARTQAAACQVIVTLKPGARQPGAADAPTRD
ncbi:MAG: serine protease [Kofleriaceae bacterium]